MLPRYRRSLQWQLGELILALILPTLLFVGILFWQLSVSERSRVEIDAKGVSRGFAVALDREIHGVLTTLQALSTSPSLQSHDFAAFYQQASEVSRLQGINISLRVPTGRAILTTRAPYGTEVGVPPILAETDQEALRTGNLVVSNIFTSTVAGRPVFQIVAAPVMVAGSPTYLLGASIDVGYLAEAIRKEHLPAGWTGAIIDRNGVFVARTERHDELAGKPASSDFQKQALADGGTYYGINSDQQRVLVGYAKSQLTGWIAAASLSTDAINGPLRRSFFTLMGLGVCLALVATLLAVIAGRRLASAFQRLGEAAHVIGQGQLVEPVLTPITEVNQIGMALQNASKQLQEREHSTAQAEAAVREREERLRLVIEGAKDHAIVTMDRAGIVQTWSAGASAIFGWSAEEVIGRERSVLFTPEDRASGEDVQELSTALKDGYAPHRRWHLRKDGTLVFMNGSVHVLPVDIEGRPQGFIKIARDETERLRSELALRELNETLEQKVAEQTQERNRLWQSTNDLIGTGDFEGYLKAVNPAWTTLLGWSKEELLARPFMEIVESSDRTDVANMIQGFKARDEHSGFACRLVSSDGNKRVIMWSVVRHQEEELFYLIGRDLTEQRQAEDALRQSQKMDALGKLTGGVAHDFNNMLAVVIGSLNLVQRRLARGDTSIAKYIDNALDGAKRAADLTQRLLAFSRQQPLSPQVIDANRMIAGMTDLLTRALGEQNQIEAVLSAGLWQALADPSQLENVILNLAVNARDAMPEGGKLTLETANAHVDDDYARESEIATGQYVLIAVSDTGCGMAPDIVAKAFDPFFTTKGVGQGTGLGLSQVFGVARQSGGHVKIYSEVGHGTTIKLYLPRSYEDATVAVPKQKAVIPPRGGSVDEIVMVVEDEDRVRNFAVDALRDLGYTVVHASSGREALLLINAGQEFSLLFTDIVMPEMTGRQLVDTLLPSRPHLKVLYMTGYSRNAVVHNGVLDPGTKLLNKPFGIEQLALAVRLALDN